MINHFKDKNRSCFICSKHFEATEKENGRVVKILSTPCEHLFHRVCLRNWFRNESNGNWCPHCKRSMEWRDATPLGKEITIPEQSSQSEPKITVQSLDAEIRQRKAQELLQRKEEAERAKLEVSDEQRAEAQERRRQRREARNAVNEEQNNKYWRKYIIFLVVIGTTVAATFTLTLFSNDTPGNGQHQNESTELTGKKYWEQKVEDLVRQIDDIKKQLLDRHIMQSERRYNLKKKYEELLKELNRADTMNTIYQQSENPEEVVEYLRDDIEEFLKLTQKAYYSRKHWEELSKFGEIFEKRLRSRKPYFKSKNEK